MISLATERRRYTPGEIASFIKSLREHLRWKQIILAKEANVDERTIQRVESGKHQVSPATLRKIANALELDDPDFFSTVHSIRSDEQIQREFEEAKKNFEKNYITVELTRAADGRALGQLLDACNARMFDHPSPETDSQASLFAELFDYLADCADIWDEISFADRLKFQRDLTAMLKALDEEGFCVCVGKSAVEFQQQKPLRLFAMYAFICDKEHPKKVAFVRRDQSGGFCA